MNLTLCAVCLTAGQNAASQIAYTERGGKMTLIHERGSQFPERVMKILSGDDRELEPGGLFRINNLDFITCVAITSFAGTSVCGTCFYVVLHDRQQNRSTYGNRSIW